MTVRRMGLLVMALVTMVASLALPASAVVNPTESPVGWAVYIEIKNPATKETGVCSGALVAPSWVLTAAHCIADNPGDYEVVDAKDVTVYLGRISGHGREKGKSYKVDRIETRRWQEILTPPARLDDDVALLHLTKPSGVEPVWLLPGSSLATPGTQLQMSGFGYTSESGTTTGRLGATKPGANELSIDCPPATDGVVCVIPHEVDGGISTGMPGDSGGLWVRDIDGVPVGTLVFAGHTVDESYPRYWYGESVYNDLTIDWIRSYVGIPVPVAGRIVRDPVSAESWLIDNDLFRRAIPDGGTYECLVAMGSEVVNLPAESLALMPARRALDATCGAGGDVLLLNLDEEHDDTTAVAAVLDGFGYSTTISDSIPADLSSFHQVWAFATYEGYSDSARVALTDYVLGGGSLLANGEWSCCQLTNDSLELIMDAVLNVDVDLPNIGIGLLRSVPLEASSVDGIGTIPNTQPTMRLNAYGVQVGVPEANVLAYDPNSPAVVASAWADGDMKLGTGRLVTIMDSNWTDISDIGSSVGAIENIAAFLARA